MAQGHSRGKKGKDASEASPKQPKATKKTGAGASKPPSDKAKPKGGQAKPKESPAKPKGKSATASSSKAASTGKSSEKAAPAKQAAKPSSASKAKAVKQAPAQAVPPKAPTKGAKPLSTTLLELHLQHELSLLQGESILQEIRSEVSTLLSLATHTKLEELVTPEQVMGVIRRNVINLKIAGGITELAGDMASRVYTSAEHRETLLKEIMTARQFEEFVEKLISLKSHRQRVVSRVLGHPVYADLVSRILYQGIVQYLSKQNLVGSNIPGVAAVFKLGKRMVDKAAPDLEANLEASLKGFIAKNMRFFVQQSEHFLNESLSDRALKGTVMDFWDAIENKPMKTFQKGIDTLDLSELVVLGYEFWLQYRRTDHFEQACRTVVEGIFEKYGDMPASVWLEDMGVSELMIQVELEAAVPRVVEVLHRNGYLEGLLRRHLESFYYSDAVQKLL